MALPDYTFIEGFDKYTFAGDRGQLDVASVGSILTSGDYTATLATGVTSNVSQIEMHGTSSTAARGGILTGHGLRGSSGPKVFQSSNTTQGLMSLFLQSTSPITNIRYYNAGGGNMTAGRLITYGR